MIGIRSVKFARDARAANAHGLNRIAIIVPSFIFAMPILLAGCQFESEINVYNDTTKAIFIQSNGVSRVVESNESAIIPYPFQSYGSTITIQFSGRTLCFDMTESGKILSKTKKNGRVVSAVFDGGILKSPSFNNIVDNNPKSCSVAN